MEKENDGRLGDACHFVDRARVTLGQTGDNQLRRDLLVELRLLLLETNRLLLEMAD
jgi:hypothetical protein